MFVLSFGDGFGSDLEDDFVEVVVVVGAGGGLDEKCLGLVEEGVELLTLV